MIHLNPLLLFLTMSFFICQDSVSQVAPTIHYTKGDHNISVITMGTLRSSHCTVIEYPEFLVIHEIPSIPKELIMDGEDNPLIAFIDSIYLNKPIKYILNSHHHRHSLASVEPFFQRGATLITAIENIEIYKKRGILKESTAEEKDSRIIKIGADTTLLNETENPIEVIYLKKSDYKSIPTETFLFFNFKNQKLLATSCMVYLRDIGKKYGYKGMIFNDRLIHVNEIIKDKKLDVEHTLQLYRLKEDNGLSKPPIFEYSHLKNVLNNSWHRRALSEHFQNMSYQKLTVKRDSILNYLIENDIYHVVLNHAIYELIDKKNYQKAVALAQILVNYEPNRLNEIDTLGEAYFNNGQIEIAKHYDQIIQNSKKDIEGLGIAQWEINKRERLQNGS